jgi:hypothetical protein
MFPKEWCTTGWHQSAMYLRTALPRWLGWVDARGSQGDSVVRLVLHSLWRVSLSYSGGADPFVVVPEINHSFNWLGVMPHLLTRWSASSQYLMRSAPNGP